MMTIPFWLNDAPGILTVQCERPASLASAGNSMLAKGGSEVDLCSQYPAVRARIASYEGAGDDTGCAWIQIVTRREFAATADVGPAVVEVSVDTHPVLAAAGVPFFAFGFPAELFDAPCDNLNGSAVLEWIADAFLVTLPMRANAFTITAVAGFRWGYREGDHEARRWVDVRPLEVLDLARWDGYLELLRGRFGNWHFGPVGSSPDRSRPPTPMRSASRGDDDRAQHPSCS